jgi:hypothetical protein
MGERSRSRPAPSTAPRSAGVCLLEGDARGELDLALRIIVRECARPGFVLTQSGRVHLVVEAAVVDVPASKPRSDGSQVPAMKQVEGLVDQCQPRGAEV